METSGKAAPNVSEKGIGAAVVMFAIKAGTVRVRPAALFRGTVAASTQWPSQWPNQWPTTTTGITAEGWCFALSGPVEPTAVSIGYVVIVHLVLLVFV